MLGWLVGTFQGSSCLWCPRVGLELFNLLIGLPRNGFKAWATILDEDRTQVGASELLVQLHLWPLLLCEPGLKSCEIPACRHCWESEVRLCLWNKKKNKQNTCWQLFSTFFYFSHDPNAAHKQSMYFKWLSPIYYDQPRKIENKPFPTLARRSL